MIEWLPDLVLLEDYNGIWNKYLDAVYGFFFDDFVNGQRFYKGCQVSIRKYPYSEGKVKAFWHMISNGEIEDERNIDFRRCERIKWPRSIIEKDENEDIWIWQNERKSEKRVLLYIHEEKYLVVLGIRNGYFLLCSAYFVEHQSRHEKLAKEYRAYIALNS